MRRHVIVADRQEKRPVPVCLYEQEGDVEPKTGSGDKVELERRVERPSLKSR
jgi:hypothetical protein